jgi:hypothetical protein
MGMQDSGVERAVKDAGEIGLVAAKIFFGGRRNRNFIKTL